MKLAFSFLAFGLAAVAAPAAAVTYTFTVTSSAPDPDDGFPNYAFQLDSSPVVAADGDRFTISGVTTYGTRPVLGAFSYTADYTFYTEISGGAFEDGSLHSYLGAQLFAGTVENPTFITGTYGLDYDFDGETDDATLVISAPAAGVVPEPGTWALMLAGFGLTGFALRRRAARPVAA